MHTDQAFTQIKQTFKDIMKPDNTPAIALEPAHTMLV